MVLQKVVPIVEIALNGAETYCTAHPISMNWENDGHYIVWSYINTKTALQQLQRTYLKAFPAKKVRPVQSQSKKTPTLVVKGDGHA